MAIYHLSVKIISRAQGRSAVAAAAYRSASRLHEQHTGLWHDFSRKQAVVARGIMLPAGASAWMRERAKLWNGVEAREARKDAQLARDVCLALPQELSLSEQEDLLRSYVQEHFVRRGMVADYAIHHDNPQNPHAHVMLTMRVVEGGKFGLKEPAWNAKARLLDWRQGWAESSNRALALAGFDVAIDARSYAEQGLGIAPGIKIGVAPALQSRDRRDVVAERLAAQAEVRRVNGAAILEDPSLATEAVTRQQATFTAADVRRWLAGHTADAAQADACFAKVMAQKTLVPLTPSPRGQKRWTTQEMLDCERRLLRHAGELSARQGHAAGAALASSSFSAAHAGLSAEQQVALAGIVGSGDIAVLEGYAGSGKSRLLGAARMQWEAQGLRVRGAALAGLAAEGLEASSGIASTTLAAWEARLGAGEGFGRRDVLVVDEAGMVGTRQLERVLGAAQKAGAKVVLVGDTAQLQAIEAGAPMRAVGQAVGTVRLTDIRRQEEGWQQEASVALAEGQVSAALQAYEDRGHLHGHAKQAEAVAAVLAAWDEGRTSQPEQTQAMLAYRRDEVAELNAGAHALRQGSGELRHSREVQTERGLRAFAEGERLVFLRNDRGLGVRNGTTGTLERIEGQQLQVRLDGIEHRRVVVDLQRYRYLDYGYASTVHRAQGMTVDRVHVLASPSFDRHVSYVACSRHRQRLDVHWSKEAFRDRAQLLGRMGQLRAKEMAIDAQRDPQRVTEPKHAASPVTEPSAIQRLWQAERLLASQPLTYARAIQRVPVVQALQEKLQEQKRRLAHYQHIDETHRSVHPILSRIPWLTIEIVDLQQGEKRGLHQCLRESVQEVKKTEAMLKAAARENKTQHLANELARKDQQERSRAKDDLPRLRQEALREHAEQEERIRERAAENVRAAQRNKQRERGRERGDSGVER